MKNKTNEEIKQAMIELINKSAEYQENFIFEKLQDYMDFEDGKATWKSNVRLRMLENTWKSNVRLRMLENKKLSKIRDELKEELCEDEWCGTKDGINPQCKNCKGVDKIFKEQELKNDEGI